MLVPCGYCSVLEYMLMKYSVRAMSYLCAVDVAPGLATRKNSLYRMLHPHCIPHGQPLAPLKMTFDSLRLPPGTRGLANM